MTTSPSSATERYLSGRRDTTSSFSYGLSRRTSMLLSALAAQQFEPVRDKLDIIDFGCADGAMLEALAENLGDRFASGLGLDVFRGGVPDDLQANRICFRPVDLFKTLPAPVEDASFDVAVVSAFLKHHPEPARFLSDVARILRPGGCALLLDPRPFVVRIGQTFGRFNPAYNPSLWDRTTIERLLRVPANNVGLRISAYSRYWIAPNYTLYRLGIERLFPHKIRDLIALHQCLVLRK